MSDPERMQHNEVTTVLYALSKRGFLVGAGEARAIIRELDAFRSAVGLPRTAETADPSGLGATFPSSQAPVGVPDEPPARQWAPLAPEVFISASDLAVGVSGTRSDEIPVGSDLSFTQSEAPETTEPDASETATDEWAEHYAERGGPFASEPDPPTDQQSMIALADYNAGLEAGYERALAGRTRSVHSDGMQQVGWRHPEGHLIALSEVSPEDARRLGWLPVFVEAVPGTSDLGDSVESTSGVGPSPMSDEGET